MNESFMCAALDSHDATWKQLFSFWMKCFVDGKNSFILPKFTVEERLKSFNILSFSHFVTKSLTNAHFFFPNRTTTPTGSRTRGLLLSTWTTPSVLARLLLQLQARPRPRVPVPLLAQAREHQRTGRAPRRMLHPQPPPQRPLHLRNNLPSAVPRASIVLIIFSLFSKLSSSSGLSVSLAGPKVGLSQASHRTPPTLLQATSLPHPAYGRRSSLAWSSAWRRACSWLQRRENGQDKENASWRCWHAYLNNNKVYIVDVFDCSGSPVA